jgi:hypothetical protein
MAVKDSCFDLEFISNSMGLYKRQLLTNKFLFKTEFTRIRSSQNYFIFGFSYIVRYSKKELENTTFCKLDLFPSPNEVRTHTLLGRLERAKLNHIVQ